MQSQSNNSLVFIDSAVTNYQSLISTISPQAKVVMLDSSSDGIAQISEELARYSDVSSVHLVSHGEPGSVQLGTTQLNFDTLARYDELLEGWAGALTDTADILLYGCNVAASDNGEAFYKR